jgi:nitrite reductase/ring-hydroxylating ferredoxin subunit
MSKLQKSSEVKGPIEVGKFYLVPFAIGDDFDIPVTLPVHSDSDLFKSTHPAGKDHYHNDSRFVKDYYPRPVYRDHYVVGNKRVPITGLLANKLMEDSNPGQLIRASDVIKIVWKRRKARRNFPEFDKTQPDRNKAFHSKLYEIGVKDGYCLKSKKICPHRGFNLESVPPDANGIIECPLHGLKFYAKSGKLVNENLELCEV